MRGLLESYELRTADTLADALTLLAEESGAWTLLAGGTDLMVHLAAGTLPPGKFLSIWGLDELRGIMAGLGISALLRLTVPGLPVYTPPRYIFAALLVSVVTGLLAGVVPARRAALLHPIDALRTE